MSSNEGSSAIDQSNAIVPYASSEQITNSVCNFGESVQELSVDEININDIDNGACVIVDVRSSVALSHTSLLDGNETNDSVIEPDITEVHVLTDSNVQSSSGTTSHFDNTPGARLIDVEERGHITSHVYATSSGTMLWMPEISESSKPIKGTIYNTWSDAVKAYDLYAEKAGFTTRIGTTKLHPKTKVITHRYILCHRASTQSSRKLRSCTSPSILSKRVRQSKIKVTNCEACIRLKPIADTTKYIVYEFVEAHNHCLIDRDNIDFSRKRRKMGFDEYQFVHKMALNKIGATKAYKLRCAIKGGVHNVKGTSTEFKNFARDVRVFLNNVDAQLVVDTLSSRMSTMDNFFFYHVAVDDELRFIFWADGISRLNYESFGDVLAFDATYKTNQYGMIFVPFTGVDHHKRCVTFGAALLCDETTESYVLLLETFLRAHKKQPLLVLTDQDSAMKGAIKRVFTESVHRLCMWHIMDKLPAKVINDAYISAETDATLDTTSIRASIHKLVWNLIIPPETFEEKWQELINTYNLRNHTWLTKMYDIRDEWIPSYFQDLPMCCLMKTTSRCESTNAMFKVNSSASNTLVQFLLCFDTAIDWQRYHQRDAEFASETTYYRFKTELPIERHAALLYTNNVFLEVQKEIDRSHNRVLPSFDGEVDGILKYTVAQYNAKRNRVADYQVKFKPEDNSASCTCLCFTRIGYLCRHIFVVFSYNQVDKIPDRYICKRWRRDALPKHVYRLEHRYSADNSEESNLRNEIIDVVTQCADRLRSNPQRLTMLRDDLLTIKDRVFSDVPEEPACNNKDAVISYIFGRTDSGSDGHVLVAPEAVKHKGRHSDARIVGDREQAIEKHKKGKRKCHSCGQFGHNSRSCAKHTAAIAAAATAAAAASTTAAASAAATASATTTAAAATSVFSDY
ncbi:hypothetical protein SSX86_017677 [Deinandra increscens subsp. villosa]|uniref:Protein FAR1-RELATED SEQUENCE n=1 Tax=Deinandra increscens subsp. villosa TaxID=3103831 RepID=A0AAP0CVL9_9ASTR